MATTELYSQVSYTSDGVATTYSIPFPYFDPEHIHVLDQGTEIFNFEFLSEGVINLDSPIAENNVLSIFRETPKNRLIDFTDGSILNSDTLDRDSNQMMFIVQEATDKMVNLITLDVDDAFDVKTKRLKNVKDAVESTDAMNMRSAMEYLDLTRQARDAAQLAEDGAQLAETNAQAAEDGAQLAETNAQTSELKAESWADEDKNVEVEIDKYSAKHWAAIAQDYAGSTTDFVVHDNTWHSKNFLTDNENVIPIGNRFQLKYNSTEDSLDIEVI